MNQYINFLKRFISNFAFLVIFLLITNINAETISAQQNSSVKNTKSNEKKVNYKVTFVELGSVRCIPCQKMQPVMKSIEDKYGKQVKVIFYDVWTPEGKPFANQYAINAIPTQVFLDENGKEFFRHEGFFEEAELIKVLQTKGVK
jgi:thioredoxin 1